MLFGRNVTHKCNNDSLLYLHCRNGGMRNILLSVSGSFFGLSISWTFSTLRHNLWSQLPLVFPIYQAVQRIYDTTLSSSGTSQGYKMPQTSRTIKPSASSKIAMKYTTRILFKLALYLLSNSIRQSPSYLADIFSDVLEVILLLQIHVFIIILHGETNGPNWRQIILVHIPISHFSYIYIYDLPICTYTCPSVL
jgi:hypothetical protein